MPKAQSPEPAVRGLGEPCDRHPTAEAFTIWVSARTGGVLTFCGHCTRTIGIELISAGFKIVDPDASPKEVYEVAK